MRAKRISMEMIGFQSGKLFQQLTDAMGKIRSGAYTTERIKAGMISDLVRMHTGMMISFSVDKKVGFNAHVIFPDIDRNHPFMQRYDQLRIVHGERSETGLGIIRALDGYIEGSVDLKNGKVGGIYSKIQFDIVFGLLLMMDKKMTDSELAAIFLHELGHAFTYLEMLGSLVTTSAVVAAAARACMEIEEPEKRKVVLQEAEEILGIEKVKDPLRLVSLPEKVRGETIQSILITSHAIKLKSETGFNFYELRSCEQVADQFAARHGAGRDLVTGLDKIMGRWRWLVPSMIPTSLHVLIEIVKLMIWLGLILKFGRWTLIITLLTTNPMNKIYDDPEARTRLIKQDLINQLKDDDLPDRKRNELLADIEAIKQVEETLDDKRTLLEVFWSELMPAGRRAMSQQEAQKNIEELLSNELFVMSAKFKQIGE